MASENRRLDGRLNVGYAGIQALHGSCWLAKWHAYEKLAEKVRSCFWCQSGRLCWLLSKSKASAVRSADY